MHSQLRQYTCLTCLGCKMVITIGEMVEWSITTVLKTVVLRGTGGSNPSLSANKGVNQRVTRFTPFITPVNLSVKKKATPKVMNLGCSLWYKRVHSLLYIWSHQNLPEVLLAKQDGIVVTAYSGNN